MKRLLLILAVMLLLGASCNNQKTPATQNQEGELNTHSTSTPNEPVSGETTSVKVAVIALGDNGKLGEKIGCDDSVVYITKNVPATKQPLNAALKQLFVLNESSVKDAAYPNADLYNVIHSWQRSYPEKEVVLKFDHATIEEGVAKIYLTGSFGSIGGVCDDPRVAAQFGGTIKQFSSVKSYETYLNGKPVVWTELFSGMGWETYINSEYGFEIHYPGNWTQKITQAGSLKEAYPLEIEWNTQSDIKVYLEADYHSFDFAQSHIGSDGGKTVFGRKYDLLHGKTSSSSNTSFIMYSTKGTGDRAYHLRVTYPTSKESTAIGWAEDLLGTLTFK